MITILLVIVFVFALDSTVWNIAYRVQNKNEEEVWRKINANLVVIIMNLSLVALLTVIHIFR